MNEAHLVIGMGQIGRAIYAVLKDTFEVYGVETNNRAKLPNVGVLHICIPYSEDFIAVVKGYISKYKPEVTIVYSTVPIRTCETIGPEIVHSPVEGRHPALEDSIRRMPRWVGAHHPTPRETAARIWTMCGVLPKEVGSSMTTEFLKLMSTAKYGINLAFADYQAKVAESMALPWSVVKEFDEDYNMLYRQLGMPQFQRYILDPPHGVIGGHCIVPNAKLLNEQFPSELLEKIISMEKK